MTEPVDITDYDIILDLQRIAHLLNSNALSEDEYYQNGGKYPIALINQFGGFRSRCELACLKAK